MKYQSELIEEIVDKRGHKFPSLHYQSECVESWIEEAKGSYPKLCDYEGEWLNYIAESPIGEFPYVTLSDVTVATVNNVVPYAYKSAILSGSTKYRDIDTGEFLETFEEGRNLELVSVKMPVLTTVGKNLFDVSSYVKGAMEKEYYSQNGDKLQINNLDGRTNVTYGTYKAKKGETLTLSTNPKVPLRIFDITSGIMHGSSTDGILTYTAKTDGEIGFKFIAYEYPTLINVQLEKGTDATPYEPYQTNILTVIEDVELGSVGEVKDELDLLTGKITQRTDIRPYQEGDELNSEFVTDMTNTRYKLTQEVVKTVDLNIVDQDGNTLTIIKPIEGTMHLSTDGETIKPTFTGEIPVEAITQNLASFIEEW